MKNKTAGAGKGEIINGIRDRIFGASAPKEITTWHNVTLPGTIYFELKKAVHIQAADQKPGDKRASYGNILQKVINWDKLRKLQILVDEHIK